MSTIELPPLRNAPPLDHIDPLEVVPNPGPMTELYAAVRRTPDNPDGVTKDGMDLACSVPIGRTYDEVRAVYVHEREDPEFDANAFWRQNFATPNARTGEYEAPPGQTIEDYTLALRGLLTMAAPEEHDPEDPLSLRHSFQVPGERFRHFFGWDSYHVMQGLAADGEWQGVLDIVDNMRDLIDRFGYVPNFNGAGASRAQPPYFPRAVRLVAEQYGPEALAHYLGPLEREYSHWMSGKQDLEERARQQPGRVHGHKSLIRMPDGSYLNRYWDDATGPRLEAVMEDMQLAEQVAHGLSGEEREMRIAKLEKDIRSGAGSGWDFGARWFADGENLATIHTTDILPIDLNSLIACTEETLALAHTAAGNREQALKYWQLFADRKQAIDKYGWDPVTRVFRDYDFVAGRQTDVLSAAMAYPLYASIADEDQTMGVVDWFQRTDFLTPGGISSSDRETAERWDGRQNIWLPPNWAAARGIVRQGYRLGGTAGQDLLDFGVAIRDGYLWAKDKEFETHRRILEKHNGDDPTKIHHGGEYPNQSLGMSNEGRRAMKLWNPRDSSDYFTNLAGTMLKKMGVGLS